MLRANKYAVPHQLALLYEFLSSADQPSYVGKGRQHVPLDELETATPLENWIGERELLKKGESVTAADHGRALDQRDALRAFLTSFALRLRAFPEQSNQV